MSLLLFCACLVHAQTREDSVIIAHPDTPIVNSPPQPFDVNGTKIADSSVAFGSDTILPSDTTHHKKHTAVHAVWLSAVCPGLGQAYNHKYWKMPIIYAGFGGLGYALWFTSTNFNQARAAYRLSVRGLLVGGQIINGQQVGGALPSFQGYTDQSDLKYFRDQYKNFLNISALVTVVWYALQLVDAAVDGHLYNYNMDDKLSMNFDPSFLLQNPLGVSQTCLGLTVTLVPLGTPRHPKHLFTP